MYRIESIFVGSKLMKRPGQALGRLSYGDSDFDPFTPVSLNERTWEASVDNETILLDTVRGDDSVSDR